MTDAKDPATLQRLAEGLAVMTARREPRDAAQVTVAFAQAIKDTKDPDTVLRLVQGLKDPDAVERRAWGLAAAPRLEPRDTGQVATAFAQAIKDTTDRHALYPLAEGLLAVAAAARPEPRSAAQAATAIAQAMTDPAMEPEALRLLAEGLGAVAARLEPRDAAPVATALARAMTDTKDPPTLSLMAQALSALAPRLEPRDALRVVPALAQAMTDTKDGNAWSSMAQALSALLSPVPVAELRTRSATTASVVAFPAGTGQPLTALALLSPAPEPPPCRLSTQQLVELLKMPPCIGPARRVVLDQLGNRYKRHFADAWQFVRFAQEQHLDLDFTTTPQRPEPGAAGTAAKR
jgi:hypothetical protein